LETTPTKSVATGFSFPPNGRGVAGMCAEAGRGFYIKLIKMLNSYNPSLLLPRGRNRTLPALLKFIKNVETPPAKAPKLYDL